jgi:NTP pyrophosphatase (non-canonical NTP hydrolase)
VFFPFLCAELTEKEREEAENAMGDVALQLVVLADHCCVDLPRAILAKMRLNAIKYPAHLVSLRHARAY